MDIPKEKKEKTIFFPDVRMHIKKNQKNRLQHESMLIQNNW